VVREKEAQGSGVGDTEITGRFRNWGAVIAGCEKAVMEGKKNRQQGRRSSLREKNLAFRIASVQFGCLEKYAPTGGSGILYQRHKI